MREQIINFKIAKLASEKGLNLKEFSKAVGSHQWYTRSGSLNGYTPKEPYWAVTQTLLQKLLREKYNIEVYVRPFVHTETHDKHYRSYLVWYDGRMYHESFYVEESFEEALSQGLLEALKIISNEKIRK